METHCLFSRCWVIASHVAVKNQYVRGVAYHVGDPELPWKKESKIWSWESINALRKLRRNYKNIECSSFEMVMIWRVFLTRNVDETWHLDLVCVGCIMGFILYHLKRKEKHYFPKFMDKIEKNWQVSGLMWIKNSGIKLKFFPHSGTKK